MSGILPHELVHGESYNIDAFLVSHIDQHQFPVFQLGAAEGDKSRALILILLIRNPLIPGDVVSGLGVLCVFFSVILPRTTSLAVAHFEALVKGFEVFARLSTDLELDRLS